MSIWKNQVFLNKYMKMKLQQKKFQREREKFHQGVHEYFLLPISFCCCFCCCSRITIVALVSLSLSFVCIF